MVQLVYAWVHVHVCVCAFSSYAFSGLNDYNTIECILPNQRAAQQTLSLSLSLSLILKMLRQPHTKGIKYIFAMLAYTHIMPYVTVCVCVFLCVCVCLCECVHILSCLLNGHATRQGSFSGCTEFHVGFIVCAWRAASTRSYVYVCVCGCLSACG